MRNQQDQLISLIEAKKYLEAEAELKLAISRDSLNAQLWVLLGETLLLQNFGQASRKAFDRAWLLDPQAQWVNHIYEGLQHVPLGEPRLDIDQLLLVPKVTVAAAILTYNEAANIVKCIQALQDAVDEIIVIDSSTDDTSKIALQYPKVKVVRIKWEDDFAAARNQGLQYVQSDWVLWVDADERLVPEDAPSVREAAGVFNHVKDVPILHAWHLNQVNGSVRHDFSQVRMFPVRRGLRYYGRIHEQVGTSKGIYENDTYRRAVKIRLNHTGYEPAVMSNKGKLERNHRLLQYMIEEEPSNPGHWLFLGRESLGLGYEEQAHTALLEAERLGQQTKAFGRMPEIYRLLIQLMLKRKNYQEAEAYCHKVIATHPEFPDAHYLLAQVRIRQADELLRLAEASIKQSLTSLPAYRGNVSADYQIGEWKAEVSLGELAMRSGKLARAKKIFDKHIIHIDAGPSMQKKLAAIEAERQRLNQYNE
ncbi:glycosyltransferase family 2 protein [Paenibacillus aceris]|uniref:Glycosyltransferase involved in cell wall biosynthesis n=1 Tax=Paenibacillus aceris TaxID=869555 RepID=A0ABS4I3D6_9BACL|nr:glycosyltransferase family 2 protein [Paenibacillus aceris]MBP1965240.1 glycosyltransferase involved in cell wall biosynthesis [Paenibacillus aceris]NHW35922.1 glycosyltransferase [Paenibacillus aceris]